MPPSIAANPVPEWGWDFAVAWTDSNDHIWVGFGKDDPNNPHQIAWVAKTKVMAFGAGVRTQHRVGVAVNPFGRVIVAYKWLLDFDELNNPYNTILVSTSNDLGSTWSHHYPMGGSGHKALGGVSASWVPSEARFAIAWVADRSDTATNRIMTLVSDDMGGTTWSSGMIMDSNNDALSMPIRQPALNCERLGLNRCLMALMSYHWSDLPVMTTGFSVLGFGGDERYLAMLANPQDLDAITHSWSDYNVARTPDGYILSYVDNNVVGGPMTFAFLNDSDGETSFFRNRQTWSGATSRSGFAIARNHRTGTYRIVWVS